MKYQDLPAWAQEEVRNTVKRWHMRWFIANGEEQYSEAHLEACVNEYIEGCDTFRVEYDEEGENPVVEW